MFLVLFGCDVDRETKRGKLKSGRRRGGTEPNLNVDL